MSGAEVEADVSTVLLGDGSTLGAFLYQEDPDERLRAEGVLYDEGGQFVVYPHVDSLPSVKGTALVDHSTLTIAVGPLYMIVPLEVPVDEVRAAKRLSLFVLRQPFRAGDRSEKTVLAASLPLDILERGSIK